MIILLIFVYILMYILTYYYYRWVVMKAFGEDIWDWEEVILYMFLSLFTLVTFIVQTITYSDCLFKSVKIKKPKWL